jgi:glycosyltransferase involved in cell wall biosynthesis
MTTLGGTLFVRNGIKYDYCTSESIKCLQELCDEVVIVDAGSDDGTTELVRSFADRKTKILCLSPKLWNIVQGREKLSIFTNMAISALSTDWNFTLQADEVLHQDCYSTIRRAIEMKDAQAYLCRRINLWGDSEHYLDVPPERSPVSTTITRLARTVYKSYDDAESINAPAWDDFTDLIRVYHAGFIRDKYKHCGKIKQMQEEIFGFSEMDKKVQEMNGVFDSWKHFSREDVKPIPEPLPKLLQEWATIRDEINNS